MRISDWSSDVCSSDLMPDGVILGARGPYGILVRDRNTALNRWFIETYFQRYGGYPSEAAYQYAQALLATKIAYDRAAAAAARFPDQEQVIAPLAGLEFERFSTTVRTTLADGHQAGTANGHGITQRDAKAGE